METIKVELTKRFIKELYNDSSNKWKAKIEQIFPEAFEDEFLIGRWYKSKSPNLCMFYAQTKEPRFNSGYGFRFDGDWVASYFDLSASEVSDFRLATEGEVTEAVINHAKKIGLVKGAKAIGTNGIRETINDHYFNFKTNTLYSEAQGKGGIPLLEEGEWARPIENPVDKKIKELEAKLKELKKLV